MQSPTTAPLRALAIATALVAGTGVTAAALVSPVDNIEAKTVDFETASDDTDQTPSTPAPAYGGGETVTPGPVEEAPAAAGSAPQSDVSAYTIDSVDEVAAQTPLPISRSALVTDEIAEVAADVFALLPDREVLTAAVTQCIDELRTLVPDLPSEIDRDAGLRGFVQGLFDGRRDGARLPRPDRAAITASIDVCVSALRGVLPAPEELMPLVDSLTGQAGLPPELTALVEQVQQLFDELQQSDALTAFDPSAVLDALRSLIPVDDGTDSGTVGILEALLGRLAPRS